MSLSSNNVKKKAYLIIISAFVIGIVTGGLFMNLLVGRSSAIKRSTTSMDNLANELQLDQSQRTQIEKIFQESRQRSKEIVRVVQPQLDELQMQTRAKVQAILRPEQVSQYEIWNQKRNSQKEKGEKH